MPENLHPKASFICDISSNYQVSDLWDLHCRCCSQVVSHALECLHNHIIVKNPICRTTSSDYWQPAANPSPIPPTPSILSSDVLPINVTLNIQIALTRAHGARLGVVDRTCNNLGAVDVSLRSLAWLGSAGGRLIVRHLQLSN